MKNLSIRKNNGIVIVNIVDSLMVMLLMYG